MLYDVTLSLRINVRFPFLTTLTVGLVTVGRFKAIELLLTNDAKEKKVINR